MGGRGQTDDDRCAQPRPGADYPVVERDDTAIRAFRDDVLAHLGKPLVDVRSPDEYSGKLLHMPNYPQEGALRGGHIPGAKSVPWARAANEDGTFKSRAELEALYGGEVGLTPSDDVVVYCRIGERSSHTWFALTHLLGYEHVRNYDGSWTEWGNACGCRSSARRSPLRDDRACFRRRSPRSSSCFASPATRPAGAPPRVLDAGASAARSGSLEHPERLEPVPECQSPLFVTTEVDEDGARPPLRRRAARGSDDPRLRRHHASPASMACRADDVLAVPDDVTARLGLAEVVSPLRLRGATALLSRIQRQVREKLAAA